MDAIAEVYASTFGPDPLGYRKEKGLLDFNEEMAILLQQVVGKKYGKYFLPVFAGVAFSSNEIRWSPRISREDGVVRIVPGLGTRAVDRLSDDYPVLLSPSKPNIRVNVLPEDVLRYSPKKMDVINLETNSFETVTAQELLKEIGGEISDIENYVSVYEDGAVRDKSRFEIDFEKDDVLFTFNNLVKRTDFIKQIEVILDVLKKNMGYLADIEFASDGDNLYLLQCRGQSYSKDNIASQIPKDLSEKRVVFTAKKFVTNGLIPEINYIIYVSPEKYNSIETLEELKSIGVAVGKLNSILPKRKFILIGPGRWGSRGDIKLGVNVTYSDINNTAMLVEVARKKGNYVPDLSFGTHFFQDLVEASIKYLPLYPDEENVVFNENFLLNSKNILSDLLPEYKYLEKCLMVINVTAETEGRILRVLLNGDTDEAAAFIDLATGTTASEMVQVSSIEPQSENHWVWRLRMAESIAKQIPSDRFNIKAVYLTGSTNNGTVRPDSDIDLIVHFDGNKEQKNELLAWFEGWGLCLSEINYIRTGYKTKDMLDITLVSTNDIEKGVGKASKINSTIEPARKLQLQDE
jgi:hypothetical protein